MRQRTKSDIYFINNIDQNYVDTYCDCVQETILMKMKSSKLRFKVINQCFLKHSGDNQEDNKFDQIVGTLQEILLDEKFEQLQKKFCNEHCMHFEATEENKLIYTDIFKKYQEVVESYVVQVSSLNFIPMIATEGRDRGI